jgi:hypothetical protein
MLIIDNVKGIEDVLGLLKRMKKPELEVPTLQPAG